MDPLKTPLDLELLEQLLDEAGEDAKKNFDHLLKSSQTTRKDYVRVHNLLLMPAPELERMLAVDHGILLTRDFLVGLHDEINRDKYNLMFSLKSLLKNSRKLLNDINYPLQRSNSSYIIEDFKNNMLFSKHLEHGLIAAVEQSIEELVERLDAIILKLSLVDTLEREMSHHLINSGRPIVGYRTLNEEEEALHDDGLRKKKQRGNDKLREIDKHLDGIKAFIASTSNYDSNKDDRKLVHDLTTCPVYLTMALDYIEILSYYISTMGMPEAYGAGSYDNFTAINPIDLLLNNKKHPLSEKLHEMLGYYSQLLEIECNQLLMYDQIMIAAISSRDPRQNPYYMALATARQLPLIKKNPVVEELSKIIASTTNNNENDSHYEPPTEYLNRLVDEPPPRMRDLIDRP